MKLLDHLKVKLSDCVKKIYCSNPMLRFTESDFSLSELKSKLMFGGE